MYASTEPNKVWYSNDSNLWVLLGQDKAVAEGIAPTVAELPKALTAPKLSLMVEEKQVRCVLFEDLL